MDEPWPSGWCTAGQHAPTATSRGCPGVHPALRLPDPARKGTFYERPERPCSCPCHNRVESEFPR